MAGAKVKQKPKPATSSSTSTVATTGTKLSAPFHKPSPRLAPFLETLSPKHIYLLHIDIHPPAAKRQVFTTLTLLNLGIVALLAWRVWYILPFYIDLFAATFLDDGANVAAVDAAGAAWTRGWWRVVLLRALSFAIDAALVRWVWPQPWSFVVGGWRGSAVWWRWQLGLGGRPKEVVVRRSGTVADDGLARVILGSGGVGASSSKAGSSNKSKAGNSGEDGDAARAREELVKFMRAGMLEALAEGKTALLLQTTAWRLDWKAMADATALVDGKSGATAPISEFSNLALVHAGDAVGWVRVDIGAAGAGVEAEDIEDSRRKQVFAFRDALAAMGKEDLFFRWVELVQFETSQPGGFGKEKQEAAAKKVRDLFDEQGIDFDEFWKESVGTDTSQGI